MPTPCYCKVYSNNGFTALIVNLVKVAEHFEVWGGTHYICQMHTLACIF